MQTLTRDEIETRWRYFMAGKKNAALCALRECEFHNLKTPEERALMRQVRERLRGLLDR